jgi:1,4-alpha-glucan branching enzyme
MGSLVKPPGEAITALLEGAHVDPFSLLGLHDGPDGVFARAILPGAETAEAYDLKGKKLGKLNHVDDRGLFEGKIKGACQPVKYRCTAGLHEWWITDAYSFSPVLGATDDFLIAEGTHLRLFDKLGAHLIKHQGASGVHFAVWAPNARHVSLVGDFNDWDHRRHQMRRRADIGVWEIFIPDIGAGRAYKFRIVDADGTVLPLKADPYAFAAEPRPATASITCDPGKPGQGGDSWGDAAHRAHWAQADARREPMSTYEVHPGSWQRDEHGWFQTWDAMAETLIPYVAEMGFTTTGLYAPSARFGAPDGFARFIDGAHRAGISVLIDWVPAHFPVDEHGLDHFDGTALYEHEDPRLGFHPDWNTAIYNFGRREVASFLVNNALYWAEHYHVDGLRVDAVASMLYRDYSREAGEWIPNADGGRENWEAVAFLRAMNKALYGSHAGIVTIAEESTSWPGVSKPVHEDGLGFGFKWNMGFMHDTLQYMARDPVHRKFHHDEITFGLVYAFSENFVLPLSHDEVVHGKGSLLTKMSGDEWQKFANLRAYYGLMWGYPGKKLLFMGQEFAQRREWSEERALDWDLLDAPAHDGVRRLVRDLNYLYREKPALHARDCEAEGFEWLVVDDAAASVFAWLRKAPGARPIAVVSNMTPALHGHYRLPLPHDGKWREILNSDAGIYGGSGKGNLGVIEARQGAAQVVLPPLATVMFEFEG